MHALLGRVLSVAPPEMVPLVETMRAAAPQSARYAAANATWSRYNTDHCCECIGGTSVPHLLVATQP